MKTEYQIEIINKVRKLREANQYSQTRIANHLGLSDGQIGNIESFKYPQKYTLSQLYRICKLFHIPITRLFIDDEEHAESTDTTDLLIQKIIRYEE